ncbi:probable G-protein coupled receptor 139 [Heterodontus francisci]|uniref:probable G-protein coupled receptor 139 n=1 Tax=Heterodontus francisci TaxID=7792 RepID=UPI00355B6FDF
MSLSEVEVLELSLGPAAQFQTCFSGTRRPKKCFVCSLAVHAVTVVFLRLCWRVLQRERETFLLPVQLQAFSFPSQFKKLLVLPADLFALLSLTVNLLAIVILSRAKCGLSTCTTRYLVAMATADLLVIITDVILWRISYYYFPESVLNITPVCSVIYALSRAATDCSVWFTVTFSFDRFVAICCQKLKTKYCTEKTVAEVLATSCILFGLKNIPFYFTREPGEISDNIPWGCFIKSSYLTEPGWVVFDWCDAVLTPLLPFALILLFNAMTVRHILVASRVRKELRHQSKGENRSDPEMESRRKSVILLFTVSGSFILLWLIYIIDFLYYSITGTDPENYHESEYIIGQVGYMLRCLSCCTNTFIYGVTQTKFREQFKGHHQNNSCSSNPVQHERVGKFNKWVNNSDSCSPRSSGCGEKLRMVAESLNKDYMMEIFFASSTTLDIVHSVPSSVIDIE